MQVVCDTSSLIKLRKAKALHLLEKLFTIVYLPKAVQKECDERETAISQKIEHGTFIVREVRNVLSLGMGHGERETISLAVQLEIEWVLIDDERAMKKAKQQGLRILQFFDILLAGKTRNLLSSVRASLDAMKAEGEGIESKLYSEILQQAKE